MILGIVESSAAKRAESHASLLQYKSLSLETHLLEKGHALYSFSNTSTIRGTSFQTHGLMGIFSFNHTSIQV